MSDPQSTDTQDELRQRAKELGVALLLAVQRDFEGTDEYVGFFVRDFIDLVNSEALKLLDRLESNLKDVAKSPDGYPNRERLQAYKEAKNRIDKDIRIALQEERQRYE